MKNLFEQSRSHWVRYDHYELKTAEDGKRYITPGKNAKPDVYNPLKEVPNIVLDALNVGMLLMGRKPEAEVEKAVMEFVTRYGLLGLMTALPTTPTFMDYEAVYLPKNHFIKEESMATDQYLSLFYPFDQLDVVKKGIESTWNVSGDRTMIALTMTFMDEPMAKTMSFQREYAEPYDWVAQQFKDWAFTLTTAFFYYNDYDFMGEDERGLHRKAMAAFGGIAPSYHIELLDKPTIYWDFHSLLLGIQMMFSFMLVDDEQPLRLCKHCHKVFLGSRSNAAFCSPRCKNQYNVYKSREKSKGGKGLIRILLAPPEPGTNGDTFDTLVFVFWCIYKPSPYCIFYDFRKHKKSRRFQPGIRMNPAGFYIIHDTGKSHWHKDLCVNYVTTLSARNFMMLLLNPSNKKEITKLPTVKSNSPLTQ